MNRDSHHQVSQETKKDLKRKMSANFLPKNGSTMQSLDRCLNIPEQEVVWCHH
jgi:hypothetical protein